MRDLTTRLAALIGLLVLPWITACPDGKYKFPTEVDSTAAPLMLATASDVTTLPADGVSTLEIIARIAAEAVKKDRKIAFTTTGGNFDGASSSSPTQIDAAPDSSGTVRVLLRASQQVGPVFVTAQVKDGTNFVDGVARMQIEFVQPEGAPVTLSVVGGATSLPADGVSTLEFRAQIAPEDVTRGRTVTLSTTMGMLVGATDSGTSIEVVPDAAGTASAFLRSSTVVGAAIVAAQVMNGSDAVGAAAQLRIDFVPADAADIVRFVEAPTSAPADGATASRFSVRVADSLSAAQRMVMFRTTAGSFAKPGGDQTAMADAGADGLASVLLYSPGKATAARLTAEVAGFEATTDIDFVTAAAERIFVTIDHSELAQNATAMVEVVLARSVGTPSEGTVVEPVALDVDDTGFGTFTGLPRSDAMGKVTLTFRADGDATPGRAKIRITAEGSSAVGEVEFELVPPMP